MNGIESNNEVFKVSSQTKYTQRKNRQAQLMIAICKVNNCNTITLSMYRILERYTIY